MLTVTSLKEIIEHGETRIGRAFEVVIQFLIVASLVAFSIETLPGLSLVTQWWLNAFEVFSVIVFTVEYLLRLFVAKPKRAYLFSFFGLVDLAAILPFYIASGVDLRSIRALRLLRLFRLLKLARYSAAARRFHRALLIAREEIVLFLSVALILLYLAAVGIYYFESEAQPERFGSVFHCLWWATTTLTTVGYGDAYPITPGGRLFTFLVLVIGLGVISVPAGLLASALGKARQMEDEDKRSETQKETARAER
jgi:voltage-gated potassium channel